MVFGATYTRGFTVFWYTYYVGIKGALVIRHPYNRIPKPKWAQRTLIDYSVQAYDLVETAMWYGYSDVIKIELWMIRWRPWTIACRKQFVSHYYAIMSDIYMK